jgi:hypothetical protein
MCSFRDADGQWLCASRPSERDKRLSPGASVLVVAALSALSWPVLISAGLVMHNIL